MPVPDEVREAMARALCIADGLNNPNEIVTTAWDDEIGRPIATGPAWHRFLNTADAVLSALEAVGYAPISVSLFGEVVAALRGATLQDRTRREDDILRRADAALLTASNPKEQAP